MKKTDKNKSRRNFLRNVTLGSALVSSSPMVFAKGYKQQVTLERLYA